MRCRFVVAAGRRAAPPDLRWRHVGLAPGGPRQATAIADDANPAGGAARAAPAHAGMGHFASQAGFKNAQALGHADGPVRIGQANHPAAALAQDARTARQKNETDRAGIEQEEIVADVFQSVPLFRRADARRTSDLSPPFPLLAQLRHGPSLLIDAGERERGKQDGACEQEGGNPRKEGSQPQPVKHPDTAVDPRYEKHRQLCREQIRSQHPQIVQRLRIAFLQSVKFGTDALRDQMRAEQGGDTQPEDKLDGLPGFPFEMPTLVQRPEPKRRMHGQRRIKQQRSARAPP
jgi:hypothetical protein